MWTGVGCSHVAPIVADRGLSQGANIGGLILAGVDPQRMGEASVATGEVGAALWTRDTAADTGVDSLLST